MEEIKENKIVEETNNDRCYTVYMHTSPSGKRYIGITRQKPEKRWGNNGNCYRNEHLKNAIKKYGWHNFKHEILFKELTKKEAEQKEIELIAYYKSNQREFGYNIQNGGNTIGTHSEESKRKMSDKHKLIGNDWLRKPVVQYSINGVFIKKWKDSHQAQNMTGVNSSSICQSCNGIVKLAGGFIWKYENEELTEDEIVYRNTINNYAPNKKSICQYSLSGILIKQYDSILSASKELKLEHASILRCCEGTQKTSGGYIWRYANESLTENHLKWCNTKNTEKPHMMKSVVQFSINGDVIKIYNSITEASLETGIPGSNISICCSGKGRQKTAGGYLWKYLSDVENCLIETLI